jgi:hypothetical protein
MRPNKRAEKSKNNKKRNSKAERLKNSLANRLESRDKAVKTNSNTYTFEDLNVSTITA